MNIVASTRRENREAKNWKYGDVQDFLNLSDEELTRVLN